METGESRDAGLIILEKAGIQETTQYKTLVNNVSKTSVNQFDIEKSE